MDESLYLDIAEMYGNCASWAVWADVGQTPKSNVGDLSVFDLAVNADLLRLLNPNIILVGLNIARGFEGTFANFHDGKPKSQDYKIRHALKNTRLYGAYMTDIIKFLPCKDSAEVVKYLRANPKVEKENILRFEQELVDINAVDPLVIALRNDAFNILNRNFNGRFRIARITHYSHHISKENYRAQVEKVLEAY